MLVRDIHRPEQLDIQLRRLERLLIDNRLSFVVQYACIRLCLRPQYYSWNCISCKRKYDHEPLVNQLGSATRQFSSTGIGFEPIGFMK